METKNLSHDDCFAEEFSEGNNIWFISKIWGIVVYDGHSWKNYESCEFNNVGWENSLQQ